MHWNILQVKLIKDHNLQVTLSILDLFSLNHLWFSYI